MYACFVSTGSGELEIYSRAPRLVGLHLGPESQRVDAAVRAALSGAKQGSLSFVVEEALDQDLAEHHIAVLADGGAGHWACAHAAGLQLHGFPGPVVVVVAHYLERVAARGFESGAHAWQTLPLPATAFCAQLESLAARLVGHADPPDVIVCLEPATHSIVVEGHRVRLRPRGFAVFVYLLRRREIWTSAERILRDVFHTHHTTDSAVVRMQVANIRSALGCELAWILASEEGRGYRVTLNKDSTAGRRLSPHPRYRGGGVEAESRSAAVLESRAQKQCTDGNCGHDAWSPTKRPPHARDSFREV